MTAPISGHTPAFINGYVPDTPHSGPPRWPPSIWEYAMAFAALLFVLMVVF